MLKVISLGHVRTFTHHRLLLLEQKFNLHVMLNAGGCSGGWLLLLLPVLLLLLLPLILLLLPWRCRRHCPCPRCRCRLTTLEKHHSP
mgnify:CR=1 FL=1